LVDANILFFPCQLVLFDYLFSFCLNIVTNFLKNKGENVMSKVSIFLSGINFIPGFLINKTTIGKAPFIGTIKGHRFSKKESVAGKHFVFNRRV